MKKITVLDIKFYPHTVRWYRRKKSKQDSTQVSCFDGFAHVETVDGMRTAHVRVICDPMEKPDKICTVHIPARTMAATLRPRVSPRWATTGTTARSLPRQPARRTVLKPTLVKMMPATPRPRLLPSSATSGMRARLPRNRPTIATAQ